MGTSSDILSNFFMKAQEAITKNSTRLFFLIVGFIIGEGSGGSVGGGGGVR